MPGRYLIRNGWSNCSPWQPVPSLWQFCAWVGYPTSPTGRTLELDNWAFARRGLTAGRRLTARYGFEHARWFPLERGQHTLHARGVAAATASR